MDNFFRNFDRLSFWLGFVAASLLWFLLNYLRPALRRWWIGRRQRSQEARLERGLSDEIRLNNDTLRHTQRMHLAAPMFSLDEVLIQPRLLAAPLPPLAYEPPHVEDLTDWAIPYTADWPELASVYGAPWLTPLEALQGRANIAIIGQPGSGKTVALAALAGQLIRKETGLGVLEHAVPVFVHAADLPIPPPNPQDPLTGILAALLGYVSSIPEKRRLSVLKEIFDSGHALLLLDGLDELPPLQQMDVTDYLGRLLQAYPALQVVAAAAPDGLDGLGKLGFQPLSLSTWINPERALFISRWSDLWNRYISPAGRAGDKAADPLMIIGWLLNNTEFLTPFEMTLKVWAAFAGDALGAAPLANIESYLRRMMARHPAKNRKAFEQMASQMALTMQTLPDEKSVNAWLGGAEIVAAESAVADDDETGFESARKAGKPVKARGAMPDLLESGLLTPHTGGRIAISHPLLAGYLAAQALASTNGGEQLVAQPDWTGKQTTLGFLAIIDSQVPWLETLIQEEEIDPLQRGLMLAGRWLRTAPEGLPWIPQVMRRLVTLLQRAYTPMPLKTRALAALVVSGSSGIPVLLRQMLNPQQRPELRQLAALGLGALHDVKSLGELVQLLNDARPAVNRAAILALTVLGDKHGLESIASLLISGDEIQRRAAAEGLANHPEEGYPTLEEGSTVEDAAVRRAVAFGLARTRQPWAIRILEKMRTEDTQWAVQDAARQVLEALEGQNPRTPRPLPALPQTPWLLSFAAERGMAVAPGKPAYDMLYRSLKDGNEDQRLAALYYLSIHKDEGAILPIYQIYFAEQGELRERAWEVLHDLAAAGYEIPAPVQFGLR